jgi:hypothetical protein
MDVGVLEEPPQVGPYKKRRTSLASKGHLPPREPSLECCRVIRLPRLCAGPTFIFLIVEVPEIERSTINPRCLGGLLDVPRDGLPRPTKVVPIKATLSYVALIYM